MLRLFNKLTKTKMIGKWERQTDRQTNRQRQKWDREINRHKEFIPGEIGNCCPSGSTSYCLSTVKKKKKKEGGGGLKLDWKREP